MPDTNYQPDDESVELARKLTSYTVDTIREAESSDERDRIDSLGMHADKLGIEAPMRDVSFVVQEFAWQWELSRMFDGEMLCVQIGDGDQTETVPMSIQIDWPFPKSPRSLRALRHFRPFPFEFIYDEYRASINSSDKTEGISVQSRESALEGLQAGLGNFLAYRIAGFRAWVDWMMGREQSSQGDFGRKDSKRPPRGGGGGGGRGRAGSGGPPPPPSSSPGGGLGVEVSCVTPGLNIEFSHAYFIHYLNFGAPSTPVKNTLYAGRYVFKGTGPTYPSGTPRSPIFRIPPDYKPIITSF